MSATAPVVSPGAPVGLVDAFAYGPAYSDVLKPASPSAGAAYVRTVPAGYSERLVSVRVMLTNSAVVVNRYARLELRDAQSGVFGQFPIGIAEGAGASASLCWARGVYATGGGIGVSFAAGIPGAFLLTGWQWAVVIENMDAGDQLSQVIALIERYPNDSNSFPVGRALPAPASPPSAGG